MFKRNKPTSAGSGGPADGADRRPQDRPDESQSVNTKKASPEPAPPAAVAAAPVTRRKPIGPKEVIPFEWKLVGKVDGLFITLFKAVARGDVEDQSERVQRDGYYTDLQILDINTKIQQPEVVKPPKPARKSQSTTRPAAKAKEPKAVTSKQTTVAKDSTKQTKKAGPPKSKPKATPKTVKRPKAKSASKTKRTTKK